VDSLRSRRYSERVDDRERAGVRLHLPRPPGRLGVGRLAGFLFETGGGHGTAFAISCTILMLAALVSLRIDERPRRVTALAPAAGGD
jgi:hypothetical protein